MKKYRYAVWVILSLLCSAVSAKSSATDEYSTSVTYSAGYQIGDYVEFVRVSPYDAGASGYYEISVSYTRDGLASAATHMAAVSHANPAMWRETGRVNNNPYVGQFINFTVDVNTDYAAPRFRIRAVATSGNISSSIVVHIKIRSINLNGDFTPINQTGNDLSVHTFSPMTNDWDLYVGNNFSTAGASLAIKALTNGNVGIGTANPTAKLSVNGNIHAQEVKVDMIGWPDYVFEKGYQHPSLAELAKYIDENKHLPEMPSAKQAEENGISLGDMNKLLLKKVEELTLHLIDLKSIQEKQVMGLIKSNQELTRRLKRLELKTKTGLFKN